MPRTKAAKYKHRIQLQKASITRRTAGSEKQTWKNLALRWASVKPLQGRELFAAQQVFSETTHNIRLRYDDQSASIDPRDYRIMYKDRVYDILTAINDQEENREIILMCKTTNEP
jgi:SPP1 family predicted phage head-tail adaptor